MTQPVNPAIPLVLSLLFAPAVFSQEQPLPWESGEAGSAIVARPSSSRDLLAKFEIDDSVLGTFVDRGGFDDGEQRVLQRVLFRLPQIPLSLMQEWAAVNWQPENLRANVELLRGQSFLLRGNARELERQTVPIDDPLRLEFEFYYRIVVQLVDSDSTAVVFARTVPQAWETMANLDEPCSAIGVFIKAQPQSAARELVFATSRVAWFPSATDESRGIRASQIRLAALGMDIGLFDDVRSRNRQPIAVEDRDCFYELLAAVNRQGPALIRRQATVPFKISDLLERPHDAHGQLMTLRGTVRRATKILVDNREVRTRLGIDSYFQLDLFVPLGNQVIMFGQDDGQPKPTFADQYPVTVCTQTLPAGLSEGHEIDQEVRVAGAFFKLWAYRSRFVSSVDEKQLQLSPMFIGTEPTLVQQPPNSRFSLLLGTGFLMILAGIWALLAWHSRDDKRFAKTVLRRDQDPEFDAPPD